MINKEMTVLEIVEKYPETESIFRDYDDLIGKCILCHCLFDSINKVEVDHNLKLDSLLNKINSEVRK